MSLLQKLENSYLGLLRVVVIVAASILLLVAVVMGALSVQGMLPASEHKMESVSVDPKDVLAQVAPDEKKTTQADEKKAPKADPKKDTRHSSDYEKIFATVHLFVTTYSKNTLKIDKEPLFEYLDKKSDVYGSDDLKSTYIAGLAGALNASLLDKRVIARVEKPATAPVKQVPAPAPDPQQDMTQADGTDVAVQAAPAIVETAFKESPFLVVDAVVDTYTTMFNQKLVDAKEKRDAKAMEQMEAKAGATMKAYIAAGVFGAFLLVIFLSIAIRIERNLKVIADKP